jgi:hypothetical protein
VRCGASGSTLSAFVTRDVSHRARGLAWPGVGGCAASIKKRVRGCRGLADAIDLHVCREGGSSIWRSRSTWPSRWASLSPRTTTGTSPTLKPGIVNLPPGATAKRGMIVMTRVGRNLTRPAPGTTTPQPARSASSRGPCLPGRPSRLASPRWTWWTSGRRTRRRRSSIRVSSRPSTAAPLPSRPDTPSSSVRTAPDAPVVPAAPSRRLSLSVASANSEPDSLPGDRQGVRVRAGCAFIANG